MKSLLVLFSVWALIGCASSPKASAIDVAQVEKDLQTTGAKGWIHGAVESRDLFVFTVRDPNNFFDYLIMSLVSEDAAITDKLKQVSRHDRVIVKGTFLKNPSPQKHILVKSIEVEKSYDSGIPTTPYRHQAEIPKDLLQSKSARFLVHAIGEGGKILVLEYKDAVVPVYVKNPSLTQGLYRNDLIELKYTLQNEPLAPTHLRVDQTQSQPVQVLESIQKNHGSPVEMEGALVLFPQSPEIKFNVFAIHQPLPDGLSRQFTLVNFDDPNEFSKIRAKLQAAWEKFPGQSENGRNKLLSQKIRIKAKGTYNLVSENQANPQILLKSADDIQIVEVP